MAIVLCSSCVKRDYASLVDPFIGTSASGHTTPAATLPFGMVQVGPDTGTASWEFCSGYHSSGYKIMGFSHTHLSGTGCGDLGDILLMPTVGTADFDDFTSAYSDEQAEPGYYSVSLDDISTRVELTATSRAAFHRYTYPDNGERCGLILDLVHGINDLPVEASFRMIDDYTLVGMRASEGFATDHRFYFCIRFSEPISAIAISCDGVVKVGTSCESEGFKAGILFQPELGGKSLLVKVGLSNRDEKAAMANLDAEIPDWDFEKVRADAKKVWNSYLSKVKVKSRTAAQDTIFYTALYHTLFAPNLVSDAGQPDRYTTFSFWDTYRAFHPFITLLWPDKEVDFVNSILDSYDRLGWLPVWELCGCETWCMIGNHAVPVVADAVHKGLDVDAERVWNAVLSSLTKNNEKTDWEIYDMVKYFPLDLVLTGSVSTTLEDCYDDYCASVLATEVGDKAKADFFLSRSRYYRNLFDKEMSLFRGRDTDGKWRENFDPSQISDASAFYGKGGDYTEANARQYGFHVQHEVDTLISMMGGKTSFLDKLDRFFEDASPDTTGHADVSGLIGQYAHGNEPCHHVPYLYTCAGRQDRAADRINAICDSLYHTGRDGLCGNDDCGQMSAWYIFSSLGFYPVDPISGNYVLGAPQLKSAKLLLPSGKKLKIVAKGISEDKRHVSAATFGRKKLYGRVSYGQLVEGGTLKYEMR